jgi:hypothetical protein
MNPTNNENTVDVITDQISARREPGSRFTPVMRDHAGFQPRGKPSGPPAQWLIHPGAKLPPRAFEVPAQERQRYHLIARCLQLESDTIAEVRRIGTTIFNAIYGAMEKRFEREAEAARLEIERITRTKSNLEHELAQTPATITREPPEPKMPHWFSVKWWGIVLLAFFFVASGTGAVANIVTLMLPQTQSVWAALVVAFVWVSFNVALKIGVSQLPRNLSLIANWLIAAVGITGISLWLTGLASIYAAELNLNNLAATGVIAHSRALPFVGQLLAELAVAYGCLSGLLALLSREQPLEVNEAWLKLSAQIAKLNQQHATALGELAKAEGNLIEWKESSAAFIAEGEAIIHLRKEAEALASDNRRLLEEFSL